MTGLSTCTHPGAGVQSKVVGAKSCDPFLKWGHRERGPSASPSSHAGLGDWPLPVPLVCLPTAWTLGE